MSRVPHYNRGHRRGKALNTASLPMPGRGEKVAKRYERGASGLSRPEPDAVYTTDGTEHRFDGKCHPDCPNVR